jgi:hypothetical protein
VTPRHRGVGTKCHQFQQYFFTWLPPSHKHVDHHVVSYSLPDRALMFTPLLLHFIPHFAPSFLPRPVLRLIIFQQVLMCGIARFPAVRIVAYFTPSLFRRSLI